MANPITARMIASQANPPSSQKTAKQANPGMAAGSSVAKYQTPAISGGRTPAAISSVRRRNRMPKFYSTDPRGRQKSQFRHGFEYPGFTN
jgi:hypothetical protein